MSDERKPFPVAGPWEGRGDYLIRPARTYPDQPVWDPYQELLSTVPELAVRRDGRIVNAVPWWRRLGRWLTGRAAADRRLRRAMATGWMPLGERIEIAKAEHGRGRGELRSGPARPQ